MNVEQVFTFAALPAEKRDNSCSVRRKKSSQQYLPLVTKKIKFKNVFEK
jgi:hypothetical protein